MKYFALVMSLLYVVAGGLLVFTDRFAAGIVRFRLPLGLLLMGYGVLRWFMWRKKQARNGE
jgi:hypothetical protein